MGLGNLFSGEHNAGELVHIPLNENQELALVWCPAGSFLMGSTTDSAFADLLERPQHSVKLSKGFWIGRTPITQEQWLGLMEPKTAILYKGENLPAVAMIWTDAKDFCKQLTYRLQASYILSQQQKIDLPTEAQWEYACRAGTTSTWYFGEQASELDNHGWYFDNSSDRLHSVGQKLPNPWGIYDLYGSVSEWCSDISYRYENHDVIDPNHLDEPNREAKSLMMIRGGDASSRIADCRSASRELMGVYNSYNDWVGLRVICSEG